MKVSEKLPCETTGDIGVLQARTTYQVDLINRQPNQAHPMRGFQAMQVSAGRRQ
jgi:hypothetical protein